MLSTGLWKEANKHKIDRDWPVLQKTFVSYICWAPNLNYFWWVWATDILWNNAFWLVKIVFLNYPLCLFSMKHCTILQQINVKNLHPESGAGIRTHNLLIMSPLLAKIITWLIQCELFQLSLVALPISEFSIWHQPTKQRLIDGWITDWSKHYAQGHLSPVPAQVRSPPLKERDLIEPIQYKIIKKSPRGIGILWPTTTPLPF